MQFEDVMTFLEIVNSGSISKAAETLYIGQGTASQRLGRLEDELGISLLWRQPGMRQVVLTPDGENFISIARQWVALQQQAEELRHANITRQLRIAATEMYNRYHFSKVYPEYLKNNLNVSLYLQTEHSTEVHQMIERQQIDIGIVGTLHKSPNIISSPFFSERFTLLCHRDNPYFEKKNLNLLDINREIYAIWSNEYELWHQRYFPVDIHRVTIGTSGMLEDFISEKGSWSIVTEFIADYLCKRNPDLVSMPFPEGFIQPRTTYLLYYRYSKPWIHDLAQEFISKASYTLAEYPSITLLNTNQFDN